MSIDIASQPASLVSKTHQTDIARDMISVFILNPINIIYEGSMFILKDRDKITTW